MKGGFINTCTHTVHTCQESLTQILCHATKETKRLYLVSIRNPILPGHIWPIKILLAFVVFKDIDRLSFNTCLLCNVPKDYSK